MEEGARLCALFFWAGVPEKADLSFAGSFWNNKNQPETRSMPDWRKWMNLYKQEATKIISGESSLSGERSKLP